MSGAARDGFFFEDGGARLYGYLHARGRASDAACVLVHPLFEEQHDAHPVLRDLAERLAARDVATLRFDLFGTGDSEGDYAEGSLARWAASVASAVAWLRAEVSPRRVALVGFRLGAVVAARAAVTLGLRRVALVAPVSRGVEHLSDLLRGHLAAEMVLLRRVGTTREALHAELDAGRAVNLFGYPLTPTLAAELREVDLVRELAGAGLDARVVEVTRTPTARESAEVKALAAALGVSPVRAVEPQPIFSEGRVQIGQSPGVNDAVVPWIAESGWT